MSLDYKVQSFRFICSLMFKVIVRVCGYHAVSEGSAKQNNFHLKQSYPSVIFTTQFKRIFLWHAFIDKSWFI